MSAGPASGSRPGSRGWTRSTRFSFSRHCGPLNTHHGLLLVSNDNVVTPGTGFETVIEAVVREIPDPEVSAVSLSTAGGRGTSWSSKSSGRTACHAMRRPCAGPAWSGDFKEVLMVRTIVRVIEPSIYDVQMFKARRVTGRASQ